MRGADGKEFVEYNSYDAEYYNVYSGEDNVAKITSEGLVQHYLKDHLGTVRAIIDRENAIVSAQDYDPWGFLLTERTYQPENSTFKFTSKQRDNETLYDYFGARYYNSRIGRWLQSEPLIDKYPQYSPYVYGLNNPMIIFDPDGNDPYRDQLGSLSDVINEVDKVGSSSLGDAGDHFDADFVGRYIYTQEGGFIDMKHFFKAASISYGAKNDFSLPDDISQALGMRAGEGYEFLQTILGKESANDPEDYYSNYLGAKFGIEYDNSKTLSENVKSFLEKLKPLDKNDERISASRIYIPQNYGDVALDKSNRTYTPYHGERPDYKERYLRNNKEPSDRAGDYR